MRIAYLDCFAGISGDMFLGSLVDAGVPLAVLEDAVRALALDAGLRIEKLDRSGIASTKVHVLEGEHLAESASRLEEAAAPTHGSPAEHVHGPAHGPAHGHSAVHTHTHTEAHQAPVPHAHPHAHGRSLTRIRELIEASCLAQPVQAFAIRTFELLGHSEAKIHNVPVERIHFHEVGAVDAIVDIVAASAGIEYLRSLAPQDPLAWFCSAINVGGGTVACAHGIFPVPAPATADLLTGMPTYSAHVQKELVTPTGAALLRALAPSFGAQPRMRVHSIGYGAGTRNPAGFPNVLRLHLGESESALPDPVPGEPAEAVMVLETALDDATPQLLAHVAERALEAGALDVMLTPVVMKKGRPATLLTVLCAPAQGAQFESLLLRETTTLGIRKRLEQRSCLGRHHVTVSTPYGEIRVKIGSLDRDALNIMPEFEDCRAAALVHDVPLKRVMQSAVAAYTPMGAVR